MNEERIVQQLHQINNRIGRIADVMESLLEVVVEERRERVGDWSPSGYEYGDNDE